MLFCILPGIFPSAPGRGRMGLEMWGAAQKKFATSKRVFPYRGLVQTVPRYGFNETAVPFARDRGMLLVFLWEHKNSLPDAHFQFLKKRKSRCAAGVDGNRKPRGSLAIAPRFIGEMIVFCLPDVLALGAVSVNVLGHQFNVVEEELGAGVREERLEAGIVFLPGLHVAGIKYLAGFKLVP